MKDMDITDLEHQIAQDICAEQFPNINIDERGGNGKYLWEAFIPEARMAIKRVLAWVEQKVCP